VLACSGNAMVHQKYIPDIFFSAYAAQNDPQFASLATRLLLKNPGSNRQFDIVILKQIKTG